jgi:polyribonucleotide nucleotidyltransferase
MVEFGADSDAAVAAYAAMEQEYTGQSSIEIVLIGSDSLATVELTHANYFDGSVAVSKYLAGLNPGF